MCVLILISAAVFSYNGYGYPSGHRMPPAASSPYFPSGYGGMPSFYMPELSSMPIGPSHSMDFMSEQFQGHYLCHQPCKCYLVLCQSLSNI